MNHQKRCPKPTFFDWVKFVHAMENERKNVSFPAPIFEVFDEFICPCSTSRTPRQISRELDDDLTPGHEQFRSVLIREEELCDR